MIYKGQCYLDDTNKTVIYDEGDFLYLNNIFENNNTNNNNKMISFLAKSSNNIIFQIDLDVLSHINLIKMKKFLWKILEE